MSKVSNDNLRKHLEIAPTDDFSFLVAKELLELRDLIKNIRIVTQDCNYCHKNIESILDRYR